RRLEGRPHGRRRRALRPDRRRRGRAAEHPPARHPDVRTDPRFGRIVLTALMGLKVAIVGRPNVGKSTLFNRLVGRKLALVDDTPGVTRDRRVHAAKLYDLRFDVIDTAGLEDAASASLEGRMRAQTETAIDEADLILFLIDSKVGIMPDDRTFADLVRRTGKPVVLIANKAEARGAEAGMLEAWELG